MSAGKRKPLKVPWLGQVGVVVRDIEASIEYYSDTFGIRPWAVFAGEPASCVEGGEQVSFKGRIAMAQVGNVQLELIQIVEGRSIHSDFLEEHGEGLHHLGFFVNDLDRRLQAARDAGVEVLHEGHLKQMGLSIRYAYLETRAVGGVIIEYIEPRFLGVPFPMRSPLLRVGARLGERFGGAG